MSDDAEQTALRASELIEREGGLEPFVRNVGIGGILFALIQQVIVAIGAAGGVLLAPWRALGSGLAMLVSSTLGAAVRVIGAGGASSAASFQSGLAALVGPFAFPLAIVSVMIGIFLFVWFVRRIQFSPLMFVRRIRS